MERNLESATIRWTTAPEKYDYNITVWHSEPTELKWHGQAIRKVWLDPERAEGQCMRYGSGLHPVWDDPFEAWQDRDREVRG